MKDHTTSFSRDIILHLLSILALYVSVGAFIAVAFGLINIYFPDPDVTSYFYGTPQNELRFPLAVIIVIFPMYCWLTYKLQSDVVANPEKRELKARKWLIQITLAAAGILIAGTLVTVVYRFLEGNITSRFLLQVLTLIAVSAAVFGYYLWNLKQKVMASKHPTMRFGVYGVLAVILAVVILGVVNTGSPAEARREQHDQQRVNALQQLQWQVIEYWNRKAMLPSNLEEIEQADLFAQLPVDPVTGQVYEYRKLGDHSFELCATFETEMPSGPKMDAPSRAFPGIEEDFAHGIGRTCFERTFDPEYFTPNTPTKAP